MRIAAQLLGACVWLASTPASAAPCPVDPAIASESAAALDVATRLAFVESALADGSRKSSIWAASWGSVFGLSTATLLALSAFAEPELRPDLYAGAAASGLAFVLRTVVHPRVIREHRRLQRRLAATGRTCETLQEAERALARAADRETGSRSLLVHLGAMVYSVSVGVVLGLALQRPLSGIRQATVGMTIGQIMLLTQPMTSVRALERYQRGALPRLSFTPLLLSGGGGFSLAAPF